MVSALPRLHTPWLDRLRTIQLGIAARGGVGMGLARQRGGAAPGGVDWSQWFEHAWSPLGAASQSASYSDLVGDTDVTPYNSPSWDQNVGWTTDGSSQYLDIRINPGSGCTMMVRFANRANTGPLWGTLDFAVGQRFYCTAEMPGWEAWNIQSFAAGQQAQNWGYGANMLSGVLCVAGQYLYRNGVVASSAVGGWTGATIYSVLIGRFNPGLGSPAYGAYDVQAVGYTTATLTPQQIAEATSAFEEI